MASRSYSASAPGSLMLLGEHAVLHGRHALVCAIDRRVRARLTPRPGSGVSIVSSHGAYEASLDDLPPDPFLRFILAAVTRLRARLPSGFTLRLESDCPSTQGLGSSAAATVAAGAAFGAWMGFPGDPKALLSFSRDTVLAVQGSGSGADVAAAVFGGTVLYRTDPPFARPLGTAPPLTIVYCGYKTATVEAIARVEARRRTDPGLFARLFKAMGETARLGAEAAAKADWPALGALMNIGQELMGDIGVNTPELDAIVAALAKHPDLFGAKISGSGLGDCAVGLGRELRWTGPGEWVPAAASVRGAEVSA